MPGSPVPHQPVLFSGNSFFAHRVERYMLHPAKYRMPVFALVITLALSSVGLPVLVMACPMGKAVRMTGCAGACAATETSGHRISKVPCRAECRFVERNTAEYISVKPDLRQNTLRPMTIVPTPSFAFCTKISLSCAPTVSPPPIRERIPILVSSLLI